MLKVEENVEGFILKVSFNGKVTIESTRKIAETIYNYKTENNLFLLTDFRNANFNYSIDDGKVIFNQVSEFYKPNVKVFEALILDNPDTVSKTILYYNENSKENHIVQIFTTEKEGIKWLKAHEHLKDY